MFLEKKGRVSSSLQLGLALGLLEDGLHLGGLHNVALDLKLATHEQALGVGLAADQGAEVLVGEIERDYWRRSSVFISAT